MWILIIAIIVVCIFLVFSKATIKGKYYKYKSKATGSIFRLRIRIIKLWDVITDYLRR